MNAIDAIAVVCKPYDLFDEGPNSVSAGATAAPATFANPGGPQRGPISQSNFGLFPSDQPGAGRARLFRHDRQPVARLAIDHRWPAQPRLRPRGASGTATVSVRVGLRSSTEAISSSIRSPSRGSRPHCPPPSPLPTVRHSGWARADPARRWQPAAWPRCPRARHGPGAGVGRLRRRLARPTWPPATRPAPWWVGPTPPAGSTPTAAVVWDALDADHSLGARHGRSHVTGDGRHDIVGVAHRDGGGRVGGAEHRQRIPATTSFGGGWGSTSVAWATVMPGELQPATLAGRRSPPAIPSPAAGGWRTEHRLGVHDRPSSAAGRRRRPGNTSPPVTSMATAAPTSSAALASTGAWFGGPEHRCGVRQLPLPAPGRTRSPGLDLVVGDFDGDGRSDLAGRDQTRGHWWISRRHRTGFATARAGSWSTTITWQAIVVVDLNGDGRGDIAGRDATTGVWWLAQSEGSGDALPPGQPQGGQLVAKCAVEQHPGRPRLTAPPLQSWA